MGNYLRRRLDRAVNAARDPDRARIHLHSRHLDIDRRDRGNLDPRHRDVHFGKLDARDYDLASNLIVDGPGQTALSWRDANRLLALVTNDRKRNVTVFLAINETRHVAR